MPAVFVGHGSPMNAIEDNRYSRAWKALGEALPRPRAILVVSAHWFIPSTAVTAMALPRTIHDFSGFPQELYGVRYPAHGDPELAAEVAALLAPLPVALDARWGLDHGAWSILRHAYPDADVPVVQLSIDETKPPAFHYELGAGLSALRERGVLVIGSGNVVHNLELIHFGATTPYDWAVRFDDHVRIALERRDDAALVEYQKNADAAIAAPDPDHYYPLLYIAGIRRADDSLRFLTDGIDARSISMRAFQVG
jgi:4,5-DOPA dioxygenase extradiol